MHRRTEEQGYTRTDVHNNRRMQEQMHAKKRCIQE